MEAPLASLSGAIRASDADRARAVRALQRHFAAGRLEADELEQRVAAADTARWRSELRALLRDMPFELPIDRRRVAEGVDRFQRALLRLHAICWILLTTVLLTIWAWGGDGIWPAVVILPTALLLGSHARGSRALSRRLGGDALRRRRFIT